MRWLITRLQYLHKVIYFSFTVRPHYWTSGVFTRAPHPLWTTSSVFVLLVCKTTRLSTHSSHPLIHCFLLGFLGKSRMRSEAWCCGFSSVWYLNHWGLCCLSISPMSLSIDLEICFSFPYVHYSCSKMIKLITFRINTILIL